MNAKIQQPTINLPGVTVFFPVPLMTSCRAEIQADNHLAARGVPADARWLVPQFSASGKPQLVFYGGR